MHEYYHGPRRAARIVMMVFAGIFFAAGVALLFGILVRELWNWLMPSLFGLKQITYWQAFGITILGKILFSGINHNPQAHKAARMDRYARHMAYHADRWGDHCYGSDPLDRFSQEDMKHYHDFWREKGEAAFEEYLRSKKEGNSVHDASYTS